MDLARLSPDRAAGRPAALVLAGRQAADQLRTPITALTTELTRIDAELADLATTRSTLRALATTEFTADDPTVTSSAYQQILTALGASATGMRATDICLALDIEPLPSQGWAFSAVATALRTSSSVGPTVSRSAAS